MNTSYHPTYMHRALQLAEQGRFSVSPNPMVGCVIVQNDHIVGEGFHQQAGDSHAEIIALEQAQENARGATAYVTLEPCDHYGRTPPCTLALIAAGIQSIYIATPDPNPLVAGRGIERLKAAGLDVHQGLCESAAIALNEIFFHYIKHRQPFVIAKWAMSLDGRTITHAQDTPTISSIASQQSSHQLRAQVDAILIGAKTAIQDDPLLTVRHVSQPNKHPLRLILSSQGDLPLDLRLFSTDLPAKTLVATTEHANKRWCDALREKNIDVLILPTTDEGQVHLPSLLTALGKRSMTSLLVEGGEKTHAGFFKANLVNKICVYLAPVIISDLEKKHHVTDLTITNLEKDIFFSANFQGLRHV